MTGAVCVQRHPGAAYAGGMQRVRGTGKPLLPSMTVRLPMGSCSIAKNSTGTPTAVPGPNWIRKELTMIVTVAGVSVTFVTRVHAPGPVTVPATKVWSSRTR